ncbi:protein of unknown function [Paraburkholderia kururiensis]
MSVQGKTIRQGPTRQAISDSRGIHVSWQNQLLFARRIDVHNPAARIGRQQRAIALRENAFGTLQLRAYGSNSGNVNHEVFDRIHSLSSV